MLNRRKSLEHKCLEAFNPPFLIKKPARLASHLIFASPHSGYNYPKAFQAMTALSLNALRRNEDSHVNALFSSVPELGAFFIYANFPRCFLDLNRAATEVPEKLGIKGTQATPRSRIGLGVVPEIIAENTPIYDRELSVRDIMTRIEALHTPYHEALKGMIETVKDTFGRAVLIDCHSMPGFSPIGSRRADIILGDRNGLSCHPNTLELVEKAFKTRGYSVKRNYPYAGGYVTQHYVDLEQGVETLQIEINRDLYMNSLTREKTAGYKKLKKNLDEITAELISELGQADTLLAAQ